MSGPTYLLSRDVWPELGSIDIYTAQGVFIMSIPMQFMLQGHAAQWHYIVEVLGDCVEEAGGIFDVHKQPINTEADVSAGNYTFICHVPEMEPTFRRGPQGKTAVKAMGTSDSSGTRSNSRRSSHLQSRFREALIYRDQDCLLTGVRYNQCTAAHIVPFSRGPELYSEILGGPQPYLFRPDMGLLLQDDLHHAYDMGDWALYPREDDYVVHFFNTTFSKERKALHGKILSSSRFHGEKEERPNPKLLRWHYRQCVQMHLRGFASRMSVQDALHDMGH